VGPLDPTSRSVCDQVLPLWVVADVRCCKRAPRHDLSTCDLDVAKHTFHQPRRMSVAAKLGQRGDVWNREDILDLAEVGVAEELTVSVELETGELVVLGHRVADAVGEIGEFRGNFFVGGFGEVSVVIEHDDRDALYASVSFEDHICRFDDLFGVDVVEVDVVFSEVGLGSAAVAAPVGAVHGDRHTSQNPRSVTFLPAGPRESIRPAVHTMYVEERQR